MTISRKLTTAIALTAILVILGPAIYRTVHLAGSADGLLLLSQFSDEDLSLNPWSRDCYLIRQDTAAAMLINFDWPYDRRSAIYWDHEPASLIHQAVSYRGLSGISDGKPFNSDEDRRLMMLLTHFVNKGLSIDESRDGYAPIHAAMISADAEVVRYLVDQGADLQATIHNPGRKVDGMDSFELSQWLVAKRPQDYQEIDAILVSSKSE